MKIRCVIAKFAMSASEARRCNIPTSDRLDHESGEYAYFIPEGDKPQIGDCILTSTTWDVFGEEAKSSPEMRTIVLGSKIARITDIVAEHPKANKFYMQLLPVAQLHERWEANIALVKKIKAREEALAELEDLAAAEDKRLVYERLAQRSERAAELLKLLD